MSLTTPTEFPAPDSNLADMVYNMSQATDKDLRNQLQSDLEALGGKFGNETSFEARLFYAKNQ